MFRKIDKFDFWLRHYSVVQSQEGYVAKGTEIVPMETDRVQRAYLQMINQDENKISLRT